LSQQYLVLFLIHSKGKPDLAAKWFAEIAELYSYTEDNEFQLNVKVSTAFCMNLFDLNDGYFCRNSYTANIAIRKMRWCGSKSRHWTWITSIRAWSRRLFKQ
jgi:hypothetical protein